jgi:formylglycine-generating enzyme required for sulfatase activity/dienelactone hydrolase
MKRRFNIWQIALCLPALGWAQSKPPESVQATAALVAAVAADMASIPAGAFQMGSSNGFTFERPIHQVKVPAFSLARHDISFEQYDQFAQATGRPLPEQRPGAGRGSLPVVNVAWPDLHAFIAWLNQSSGRKYRLPSEAEWEYAARAGSSTAYPWGNTFDHGKANAGGKNGADQWEAAAPVGSFPPNAFGLYDMIGNVWQWTQDCSNLNYRNAPADGSAWTTGDCSNHLVRGGSWIQDPTGLRVSLRLWYTQGQIYQTVGFRLAEDNVISAATPGAVPAVTRPAPSQQAGGNNNTFAAQQKSQGFATEKLARSPRRNEWVTIKSGGRDLKAWVDYPQVQGKVPVVLVLHEVFGLTDSTRNTADEVAAMGYITISPDMNAGMGPNGGGTESFPTTRAASQSLDTREDIGDIYNDLEAWMDYGSKLPQSNGKIGIVGLTWGGGMAFRYAVTKPRQDLKTVLVFTGAGPPFYNQGPTHIQKLIYDWVVHKTHVPVYGFYGEMDLTTAYPVLLGIEDTKHAMAAVGNFYEPVVYEGAEHAYMRFGEDPDDKNPANALADKASLVRMQKILEDTLK